MSHYHRNLFHRYGKVTLNRLNDETGRYIYAQGSLKETSPPLWEKRCKFCTFPGAKNFLHLPFAESEFVQDELHVLIDCLLYHELCMNLDPGTKSHLLRNVEHWKLFEGQIRPIREKDLKGTICLQTMPILMVFNLKLGHAYSWFSNFLGTSLSDDFSLMN